MINNFCTITYFLRFNYKLLLNDGKLFISGKSIQDDSDNYTPINFMLQYAKYEDSFNNVGGEVKIYL